MTHETQDKAADARSGGTRTELTSVARDAAGRDERVDGSRVGAEDFGVTKVAIDCSLSDLGDLWGEEGIRESERAECDGDVDDDKAESVRRRRCTRRKRIRKDVRKYLCDLP